MNATESLSKIVSLKEDALLSSSVQLDLFFSESRRLALANGFIFSYREKPSPDTSELSAVEVLRFVKDGLSPQPRSNVLSLVSTYGSGKSHLALTLATFFGLTSSSPEVTSILNTLASIGPALKSEFESYKALSPKPHLVIPVTLSDHSDLRQAVRKGISRSLLAHNVSFKASEGFEGAKNWLNSAVETREPEIKEWLSKRYPGISLTKIQRNLEDFDSDTLDAVTGLSKYLNNGLPIDFGHDENVGQTLCSICERFCGRGVNHPFAGVIIILDEFSSYLEFWTKDRARAGGMAIQELTDACSKNPGQLFLLTLNQYNFQEFEKRATSTDGPTLAKLTQRLEPSARIISSLEQVLGRIIQQSKTCEQLIFPHEKVLSAAAKTIYNCLPRYQVLKLTFGDYYKSVALGCFPLHPSASSLLCHLADTAGFVQGRSIITFLNTVLKRHLENPTQLPNGTLNLLSSIQVFNYLEDHFRNLGGRVGNLYQDYISAMNNVGGTTAALTDQDILKAVLLGEIANLTRPENHEVLIAALCGYDPDQTLASLQGLVQRAIIKLDASQSPPCYTFYRSSGGRADEEVSKVASKFSNFEISAILSDEGYQKALLGEVRELSTALFSTRFQRKTLSSSSTWHAPLVFKDCSAKAPAVLRSSLPQLHEAKAVAGVLFWDNREAIDQLLKQLEKERDAEYNARIVYAVPLRPVMGARVLGAKLLAVREVRGKLQGKLGEEVFDDLTARLLTEYQSILTNACKELRFFFVDGEGRVVEKDSADEALLSLFTRYYTAVPPTNYDDKLASPTKGAGTMYLPTVIPSLLRNELAAILKGKNQAFFSVVNNALVDEDVSMELVQREQFKLRDGPGNGKVREAWDLISGNVPLGQQVSPTVFWDLLSRAPYGYDYNTFLLLLSCWLGSNKEDLSFSIKRESCPYDRFVHELTLKKSVVPMVTWLLKDVKFSRSNRGIYLKKVRESSEILRRAADLSSLQRACDQLREAISSATARADGPSEDQLNPAQHQLKHAEKTVKHFTDYREGLQQKEASSVKNGKLDSLVSAVSSIIMSEIDHRAKQAGATEEILEAGTDLAYEIIRRLLKAIEAALSLPKQPLAAEVVSEIKQACSMEHSGLLRNSAIRAEVASLISRLDAHLNEWRKFCHNQAVICQVESGLDRIESTPYLAALDRLTQVDADAATLFSPCAGEHQERLEKARGLIATRLQTLEDWFQSLEQNPTDLGSARRIKETCLVNKSLFLGSALEAPLEAYLQSLSEKIHELEDDEDQRLKARLADERLQRDRARLQSYRENLAANLPIQERVKAAIEGQALADELNDASSVAGAVKVLIAEIRTVCNELGNLDDDPDSKVTFLRQATGPLFGTKISIWMDLTTEINQALRTYSTKKEARANEQRLLKELEELERWVQDQIPRLNKMEPEKAIRSYENILVRCKDSALEEKLEEAAHALKARLEGAFGQVKEILGSNELDVMRKQIRVAENIGHAISVSERTKDRDDVAEIAERLATVQTELSSRVENFECYSRLTRQLALLKHPEDLQDIKQQAISLPKDLQDQILLQLVAWEATKHDQIKQLLLDSRDCKTFADIPRLVGAIDGISRWCSEFPPEGTDLLVSAECLREFHSAYKEFVARPSKSIPELEARQELGKNLLERVESLARLKQSLERELAALAESVRKQQDEITSKASQRLERLEQTIAAARKRKQSSELMQLRRDLTQLANELPNSLRPRADEVISAVDNELADNTVMSIVDQYQSLPEAQRKRCLELLVTSSEG